MYGQLLHCNNNWQESSCRLRYFPEKSIWGSFATCMQIAQTCRGCLHPEKEKRKRHYLSADYRYSVCFNPPLITTIAITSNTSTFSNIAITATDTFDSYYLHHYIFLLNLALNDTTDTSTNLLTLTPLPNHHYHHYKHCFLQVTSVFTLPPITKNNITIITATNTITYYQYYHYCTPLPPPLRLLLHFYLIFLPMLLLCCLLLTFSSDPPHM